jgi:hypothetical protein
MVVGSDPAVLNLMAFLWSTFEPLLALLLVPNSLTYGSTHFHITPVYMSLSEPAQIFCRGLSAWFFSLVSGAWYPSLIVNFHLSLVL